MCNDADERESILKGADAFAVALLRPGTATHSAAFVWPFDEAPGELRALSEHGGDEDWLILWPPGSAGTRPDPWVCWQDYLFRDGAAKPVRLPCGAVVLIAAHA